MVVGVMVVIGVVGFVGVAGQTVLAHSDQVVKFTFAICSIYFHRSIYKSSPLPFSSRTAPSPFLWGKDYQRKTHKNVHIMFIGRAQLNCHSVVDLIQHFTTSSSIHSNVKLGISY